MVSFTDLKISLSLVFGCLLLAIFAELYYLVWWKRKRITDREIEYSHSNYVKELLYVFGWKKPSENSTQELGNSAVDSAVNGEQDPEIQLGDSKEFLLKPYGEDGLEAELIRIHNLAGPPRFLFTIKEETKEDLESEDGKSRGERSRKGSRNRSLSDLVVTVETPFLTPLSSPRIKSNSSLECLNYHSGFNPLFESSMESEINRLRSSPPPKFKFLRDAEEKLYRRKLMEEAERKVLNNHCGVKTDGCVISFLVGDNEKERGTHHNFAQYHSSSSQVLPLDSSPSSFKPSDRNPSL